MLGNIDKLDSKSAKKVVLKSNKEDQNCIRTNQIGSQVDQHKITVNVDIARISNK